MCPQGLVLPPLLYGGGQEKGLRGGTENVASIVGYGVACELVRAEGAARAEASGKLRDRLWQGIESNLDDVRWNGGPGRTLDNTLNVEFTGVEGEVLLQALDLEGVAKELFNFFGFLKAHEAVVDIDAVKLVADGFME